MKFALIALLTGCMYGKVETPAPAEDTAYKLFTPDGAQCTAWAVGEHSLITAGHCCDMDPTEAAPVPFYAVQPGKGWVEAEIVTYRHEDQDMADPLDVCALSTEAPLGAYLELADEMPAIDAPVEYVGYPLGEWIHSTGVYKGDVDGPFQFYNNYVGTAPCDHGASGSAMTVNGKAYGVLVRLMIVGDQVLPGDMGCVASPLDQIRAVLGG